MTQHSGDINNVGLTPEVQVACQFVMHLDCSSDCSTIALYTLHFVEIVMSFCDHTCFQSPPKAPEALRILLLISIPMVLSDAIVL